jgi:hypothetical protein
LRGEGLLLGYDGAVPGICIEIHKADQCLGNAFLPLGIREHAGLISYHRRSLLSSALTARDHRQAFEPNLQVVDWGSFPRVSAGAAGGGALGLVSGFGLAATFFADLSREGGFFAGFLFGGSFFAEPLSGGLRLGACDGRFFLAGWDGVIAAEAE